MPEGSKDVQEVESCVFIQRRMRGIYARKLIENMRAKERVFLGFEARKKEKGEEDPLQIME
jgi:hypothetical protein